MCKNHISTIPYFFQASFSNTYTLLVSNAVNTTISLIEMLLSLSPSLSPDPIPEPPDFLQV